MTVSRDTACDDAPADADAARRRAIAALDELTPREAPDGATTARPVPPAPPLASDEATAAWVRRTVAGMRRALADGSLHHHRPQEVPGAHRSHAADVVRAWAAGHGSDVQRRLCGVCTPQ